MNKDSCYFNHSWPMLNDVLKLIGKTQWCDPNSNGCLDFNDQRIPTVSRAYKRGLNMCSITEDEAVKMFQAFRDKHLCNYAIANMPFSCESAEPPSIPQRFSLAYANSLLLYTVFSTICVKLFFAAKKEPRANRRGDERRAQSLNSKRDELRKDVFIRDDAATIRNASVASSSPPPAVNSKNSRAELDGQRYCIFSIIITSRVVANPALARQTRPAFAT